MYISQIGGVFSNLEAECNCRETNLHFRDPLCMRRPSQLSIQAQPVFLSCTYYVSGAVISLIFFSPLGNKGNTLELHDEEIEGQRV